EPLELDGDAVRLAQVLINLLNNATRYTPPGGRIWLTIEHTPPTGAEPDAIVMRVRDSGIGIRPEVLPHVFDMFTQGESLPQQGKAGLGIGLTLVQSLVVMHGGR